MAVPKVSVPSPTRKPRVGGIKSVIGEFTAVARLGAAESLEWISDGCEFPKAAPGLCYTPIPVTGDKAFVGIDHGSGPIFGLYQGVKCFLGPDQDFDARARQLLEQGEGRGVEEVLWEYLSSKGGTGPAQTSWVAAIGQMDEAADTLYIGRPVIMLSRFAAVQARAAGALFGSDAWDGALWTANGTPVIASSAAPDNVAAVFGWPSVYASEITVIRAVDHAINTELALAERLYGIAVDCEWALHYAVTVAAADPQNPDPDELALTIGTEPASPIPDDTDMTVTVHANRSPDPDEVHLFYRINAGAWVDHGEMTEASPLEYVANADGALVNSGDQVQLYAKAGAVSSPVIVVDVT